MTSQTAFDSLRMAATLALALPSLGMRISSPGRPLIEVSWLPKHPPHGVRHMPPCLFRRAVGCAHHRRQTGQPVAFLGLPEGVDPTVEALIAPGDRRLPSGIYQVRVDGGWRVVFPCLVPPARAAGVLAGEWPDARLHPDHLTEVTLVAFSRTTAQGPVAGAEAEQVVGAQARLLVEELVAGLSPAPRS